jgi:hypothetical protein
MADETGKNLDPQQVLKRSYREETDDSGSLAVRTIGSFVPESFDFISVNEPDTVTEEYTYKSGGASGTTVAVVTIVYTDATKEQLSTITRT